MTRIRHQGNYPKAPITQTTFASRNGRSPSSRRLSKPKRLKIITQFYPPDYAATGQLIEELANHLQCEQMQVSVFTSQPSYAFNCNKAPKLERNGSLLVQRSGAARFWSQRIRGKAIEGLVFFLRSIVHLLRAAHRTDILLLTTAPPFLPVLGYLFNRFFGLQYVCLLYDIYPDIATKLYVIPQNHWLGKGWDWFNHHTWRRSQAVIVLSSTMKEHVIAKCPEVADRVKVIHNWANPKQIVPIDKQDNWFAHQHKLVHHFTVVYSGNMGRCHDLDTIMDAMHYLKDEPIQFVFIGDGAKCQDVKDQTERLGLTHVRFLPYQDRDVLPYSLTAADLLLVSISDGMEGLVAPSKLYSALAAGRPVAAVCNKRAYLQDLITQAQCGAVFSNGDGVGLAKFIHHLYQDSQLATAMGQSAREYFQSNFTPDIIAKRYHAVLTEPVSF